MTKLPRLIAPLLLSGFMNLAYSSALTRAFVPDSPNSPHDGGSHRWVDQDGRVVDDAVAAEVFRLEERRDLEEATSLARSGIARHEFYIGSDGGAGEHFFRSGYVNSAGHELIISEKVAAMALRIRQTQQGAATKAAHVEAAQKILGSAPYGCERYSDF